MKTNIVQVTEDEVREMEKYARVMPQTDDDGNLIVRRYVYRHDKVAYWTGEHRNICAFGLTYILLKIIENNNRASEDDSEW
jgi:hypothetical protein